MNVEKAIFALLENTKDSMLNLSPSELELKSLFSEQDHHGSLHLQANFPSLHLQETLVPPLKKALQNTLPHHEISIVLEHFINAHRTQMPGKGLRGVKNTIAIASGKGGVGKSTVTVNLASALARCGARVGILDADIYGPSIPLMLGQCEPVQISGDKYLPVFAHGVYAMSMGYLTEGDPALIWRGPMLAKSLLQMIDITQWNELDYLLIDLPPGTGDIQLSLIQKIPLTGAVIVTTPQTVATLDAEKAIKMFRKTNIDVLGIIENMAFHQCSHCGHQDTIFSHGGAYDLCKTYHCQSLGQLPLDGSIRHDCDQGFPTARHDANPLASLFIKTALLTAIELSKKPLNYADKFPDIVVE